VFTFPEVLLVKPLLLNYAIHIVPILNSELILRKALAYLLTCTEDELLNDGRHSSEQQRRLSQQLSLSVTLLTP